MGRSRIQSPWGRPARRHAPLFCCPVARLRASTAHTAVPYIIGIGRTSARWAADEPAHGHPVCIGVGRVGTTMPREAPTGPANTLHIWVTLPRAQLWTQCLEKHMRHHGCNHTAPHISAIWHGVFSETYQVGNTPCLQLRSGHLITPPPPTLLPPSTPPSTHTHTHTAAVSANSAPHVVRAHCTDHDDDHTAHEHGHRGQHGGLAAQRATRLVASLSAHSAARRVAPRGLAAHGLAATYPGGDRTSPVHPPAVAAHHGDSAETTTAIAAHGLATHWLAAHRVATRRLAAHGLATHRVATHRLATHRLAAHGFATHGLGARGADPTQGLYLRHPVAARGGAPRPAHPACRHRLLRTAPEVRSPSGQTVVGMGRTRLSCCADRTSFFVVLDGLPLVLPDHQGPPLAGQRVLWALRQVDG